HNKSGQVVLIVLGGGVLAFLGALIYVHGFLWVTEKLGYRAGLRSFKLTMASSVATIFSLGSGLILGIALVVLVTIWASYLICLLLGLTQRLSILIACGNSICGNSAIAAIAPVIGAENDEIASSISFTAVLGVVVLLGLPLLVPI